MEDYEEINQKLETMGLLDQMLLIATFIAGRDLLFIPISNELVISIERFKEQVFDCILGQLNLLEVLLCGKELKKFIMDRCLLSLDASNRVKIYYKGEVIGTVRFNYKEKELDKEELKKLFENAIETGRDVCVEMHNSKSGFVEYIVTKNEDLQEKLSYYLKEFNDDLSSQDGNTITDVLLFHFII